MDIANYLSELLGRHGEINVPGLGYFVHQRVNGYYNDAEGVFYPPGFKIQFDPHTAQSDDDTLAKYIAESKKISLASSKYFTEKYIGGLKTEVALQDVAFADLGWFYMDKGAIAFRSTEKRSDNAAFFGLEPVVIRKLKTSSGQPAPVVVQSTVQATPLPLPTPPSLPAEMPYQPIQAPVTEQPEEYYEDERETRRGVSTWAIILIVLIVLAIAAFGIYKFKPELFGGGKGKPELPVKVDRPELKPEAKIDTDTTKIMQPTIDTPAKAISKPDSTLNKPAAAVTAPAKPVTALTDTFTKVRYELLAGAFKKEVDANYTIAQYKKLGFTAHIVKNVPGKLVKVSLGTYFVRDEAVAAKQKITGTGKIKDDKITIQPYNPKK